MSISPLRQSRRRLHQASELQLTGAQSETVDQALEVLAGCMREKSVCIGGSQACKKFLSLKLGALRRECFGVLFLDTQLRMIAFEVLFRGTLNEVAVYPREVLLRALSHDAAAVVLAHNHPSGVVSPSDMDRALTKRLKDALSLVDVRVLDHVIVAAGADAFSFADVGLI